MPLLSARSMTVRMCSCFANALRSNRVHAACQISCDENVASSVDTIVVRQNATISELISAVHGFEGVAQNEVVQLDCIHSEACVFELVNAKLDVLLAAEPHRERAHDGRVCVALAIGTERGICRCLWLRLWLRSRSF